ncbi:hypothetical protein B0T18DRAFT_387538 [Schizothecium vesticola]|uniref:Uncharacterized protein n=1 Tax=Schizothecium vesticola TaxID=314040 RepID=A0AA40F557_9PEZI|nr:hypothetical protein B0T18DRAFT_387538 [Schizothecium vesticola]
MRLNIFLVAVATTAVVAIDSTSPNPIRVTPAAKLVRHRLIRRSDSEHVVLTDCTRHRKNYLQASQLAYFVGPPDDSPDRTTNVTSDKQQAWAGSGKITIKSSDNVAFSVEIPTVVGEGQFAGSGHNGYSAFSCYAMFKTALYTTKEGLVCDQVYDCDHTTPPEFPNRNPCNNEQQVKRHRHKFSAAQFGLEPTQQHSRRGPGL